MKVAEEILRALRQSQYRLEVDNIKDVKLIKIDGVSLILSRHSSESFDNLLKYFKSAIMVPFPL